MYNLHANVSNTNSIMGYPQSHNFYLFGPSHTLNLSRNTLYNLRRNLEKLCKILRYSRHSNIFFAFSKSNISNIIVIENHMKIVFLVLILFIIKFEGM